MFDYKKFLSLNNKFNNYKIDLNKLTLTKQNNWTKFNSFIYKYNLEKNLSLNFKNSGYFLSKTKFVSDSFIKNKKFKLKRQKQFLKLFRYLYNKNKLITIPLVKKFKNNVFYRGSYCDNYKMLTSNVKFNKFQNINFKYTFIKSYLIFISKFGVKYKNKDILFLLSLALKSKNNLLINNLFLNIKSKLYNLYKNDVNSYNIYKKKNNIKKFNKYKVKLKFNKNFSLTFLKKWEKFGDKIGEDSTFLNLRLFLKKKTEYKQQEVELIKENDQSVI